MASAGNDLLNGVLGGHKPANSTAARSAITTANFDKFQSIDAMRTYLLANGYTNAQLDIMDRNDMGYACRKKLGLA